MAYNGKEFVEKLKMITNKNQKEIAEDLGLSAANLNKWKNEESKPSVDILLEISKKYNCSIDYLLGVNKENVSPDLLDLLRNIIIYDFKQRDPLSDLLHISETDHYIDIKTELDEDVLFKTNATVRFYTYGKTNYVGMLLNGYLKLKEALRLDLIDEDMSMKMIEELINRFRPELSSTDNQAIDSPFK